MLRLRPLALFHSWHLTRENMHLGGLIYTKNTTNKIERPAMIVSVDESCHVALLSSEGRSLPMPAHTDEKWRESSPCRIYCSMIQKNTCKKKKKNKSMMHFGIPGEMHRPRLHCVFFLHPIMHASHPSTSDQFLYPTKRSDITSPHSSWSHISHTSITQKCLRSIFFFFFAP